MPRIEILGFWPDQDRKLMELKGSKLRFLKFLTVKRGSMKLMNDLYWKMGLWVDWGVGHGRKKPLVLNLKQSLR
jgi:hypothetical protein